MSSKIQAVLFPKSHYKKVDCIEWLKNHKYTPLKEHTTEHYYRYRLLVPNFTRYRSIVLPNHIVLIYGYS